MAASTLAAMTGLIIYRSVMSWRERRDATRSKELLDVGIECLEEPDKLALYKTQLGRRDRRLLLQALSELLLKVRGDYADRVAYTLRELGFVKETLKQLRSKAWWKRMRACSALATFDDSHLIAALQRCLNDPRIEVRLEAARALVRLGAAPAVRTLLLSLSIATHAYSLAVTDLFRKLAASAVPDLMAALESDLHLRGKLLAIDALGQAGELAAVPTLLRFRHHADVPVRAAILRALTLLADPTTLPAALEALQDPAWQVRAEAANCAGQLVSLEAVLPLQERLWDDQWWVRYRAAEALLRLGIAGLVALWRTASKTGSPGAEIAQGILREKGLITYT